MKAQLKEEKNLKERKAIYEEEGNVAAVTGGVTQLIVGTSVSIMILVLMAVMSAQVYQQNEADINAINDTEVRTQVQDATKSSFKGLSTIGKYIPLIVLVVVVAIIIALVGGFGAGATAGGGRVL